MFDVSLGEFILILLIAMVFVGPENLPRVARKIGGFIGQIREAIFTVRQEVEKDEQAAQVFTEVHQTVSELASAVNIRKVVREMGAPLMQPDPPRASAPMEWGESAEPVDDADLHDEAAYGALPDEEVGDEEPVDPNLDSAALDDGEDSPEEHGAKTDRGVPWAIMEEKSTKTLEKPFHRVP